ncbi:MAG TPA: alpha/beta fold hydrolase [Holophagaceae bacterium]|jgi:dienelactone hydrolase|nr:alpha/beta fold hydrolase [Holophagaceae bacterium]
MRALRLLAPISALFLVAPLAATEPSSTPVSFTTPDGFTIKGTLTIPATGPKRHPVVIFAPQFHQTRDSFAPLAERLNARGIATLALDLRGHGESTDKSGAAVAITDDFMASAKAVGFDKIPSDLAQAAAWVRKHHGIDGRRVGLAGASVGAFSVLMASGKVRPQAVLALSPAGNEAFGGKALDALKGSVTRGGGADLVFAAAGDKDAADNATALATLPGVSVLTFEGSDHGSAFLKDHSETMAVFFGEYLLYRQAFNRGTATATDASKKGGVVTPAVLAGTPAAQGDQQPAPPPPPSGN